MSPSSSGGRRSTTGSRPTTSWLRLRSTASASRSVKCVTATVATARKSTEVVGPLLLDGLLERAARGELRHARRRDLDLLRGVARIHAHARLALLCLELPEAGE